MKRYEGPLEVGMILTAPDNDGELGYRRIRLVARDLDGERWIYEDLPARIWRKLGPDSGHLSRVPEINIRIVFEPEGDPS